jgi:N-acetylneuraminic acid mutarotase
LANGKYELRFRLYDSLTGGNQVGSDQLLADVGVTNGLFSVQLSFGNGVFTGADRFLEMAARPSGDANPLSVFDPRQLITAVPYALYSLSGSVDASALTSGTLPDARLSSNIPRTSDLLTLSNSVLSQVNATNSAFQTALNQLSVRLDSLTTQVASLSNQVLSGIAQGVVVASMDPADSTLLGKGLAKFSTLEAVGWKDGAAFNAPAARLSPAGVWTGSKWLVWGGTVAGSASLTGGEYIPATDSWRAIPTTDAPSGRSGHTAVWTGDQLLIWGGFGGSYLATGGAYSPSDLSWTALGTTGVPSGRSGHVGVWTGSRLLIWGGQNSGGLLSDGSLLNPTSGGWTALPTLNEPSARRFATAVWAGDRLIVFGGEGESGALGTGAFLPVTGGVTAGAWQALPSQDAPSARYGHTAVWTGTKLMIWGGSNNGTPLGDGAVYDPTSNTWTTLPSTGAPTARFGHVSVWTGTELLVFGGEDAGGPLATGGAYDPVTGLWRALSTVGSPLARTGGVGTWTGSELLVFGGSSSSAPSTPLASLQRLNPQPTWYLYRKP